MDTIPPFRITQTALDLMDTILELVGQCQAKGGIVRPELMRLNRNRSIQASLSIEGNTLSLEAVEAIAEGRLALAEERERREVENALSLYGQRSVFDPYSENDLLRAHSILMTGLSPQAGAYRRGSVGIKQGNRVVHVAPPAARVPTLIARLLDFLRNHESHWLVRSCVFHYEFEFIHPFADGNGRMGRFWQTLFLASHRPLFGVIPIETLLKERQADYYRSLAEADAAGHSTGFIEFMLTAIRDTLNASLPSFRERLTPGSRLQQARQAFGQSWFTRKGYLALFPDVNALSGSRDLAKGVTNGLLERQGEKAKSRYRFKSV